MRRSIPTALGLVALGGLAAALAGRPAGDPVARCSLELPGGASVALRYVPRPYDAEQLRELRRDPGARQSFNDWFPTVLQGELEISAAVVAGELELPAGTYRVGLGMNDAGALQLRVLQDRAFHVLPLDLTEGSTAFPYLCLCLTPVPGGLFQMVVQWGPETGTLQFQRGT